MQTHFAKTTTMATTIQDGAAAFLRANGYNISTTGLIARRAFGKAPAFYKVGVAVRYTERSLREFLKTAGLRGLPEREPERLVA